MTEKQKKPELLAPAGSLEKLKIAFAFGADAVYAGIPDFSLRARINTFDISAISEGVAYAHSLGKRMYVTLNLLAHNKHIRILPGHIKALRDIGSDGLIVADPGVGAMVKELWPDAKLILSTQANCTNYASARFWSASGYERIILGRETGINEIKEIRQKAGELELECFVHGALCMAYSGRCFISKWLTGRSANLGDCVQPCRWEYELELKPRNREGEKLVLEEGKDMSYILNSEDLCLLKRIPELVEAGLDSFKIEGRAKSIYYLATVVGAYRRAIDLHFGDEVDKDHLIDGIYRDLEEKLFNRGYTEGFVFAKGQRAQQLESSHKPCNWEFCGQVLASEYDKSDGKYSNLIKVHNSLKVKDQVEALCPGYDIIQLDASQILDPDSVEAISEAHGGQERSVIIKTDRELPKDTILRRKFK